jgi:hypothetical protein
MRQAKGIEPMKIRAATEAAVYRFTWWDRYAGKEVVSPRSATLEAITRCKGTPIEDTRLVVNSRDVDANGFYSIPNG